MIDDDGLLILSKRTMQHGGRQIGMYDQSPTIMLLPSGDRVAIGHRIGDDSDSSPLVSINWS